MIKLNFSRPDILYAVIWTAVLCMVSMIPASYIVPLNEDLFYLVVGNIVSFLVVYFLVSKIVRRAPSADFSAALVAQSLSVFMVRLFVFWFFMYLVVIAYSGGIPLLWKLLGMSKNYMDFGVPSLSGFLNMIRAFMVSGCVFIYMVTGRISFKLKTILAIIVLFGFAEFTRANFMIFFIQGVAVWLMFVRVGLFKSLKLLVYLIVFIMLFGIVGDVRGGHANILDSVGGAEFFVGLPTGFFWVFTYMASPLNNISYAMNEGLDVLYYPYFTLQPLIPTVIRGLLFTEQLYPVVLANEAFNATSYYSPFIADFGPELTFFLVVFVQIIVSYVHCKAMRQGRLFYILSYPPLFMCVLLSVFYSYFFSMIVVFYPFLVTLYVRYHRHFVARKLLAM